MLHRIRSHRVPALPLLALFAIFAVGCHKTSDLIGTWSATTVSGQPVNEQTSGFAPTIELQSGGQYKITKFKLHGYWTLDGSTVTLHSQIGTGKSVEIDPDNDQKLTLSEDRKTLTIKLNNVPVTLQKQPTPPQ